MEQAEKTAKVELRFWRLEGQMRLPCVRRPRPGQRVITGHALARVVTASADPIRTPSEHDPGPVLGGIPESRVMVAGIEPGGGSHNGARILSFGDSTFGSSQQPAPGCHIGERPE